MVAPASSRSILKTLGWIPVALFFNEHVYSLATVKGRSMQVSSCRVYLAGLIDMDTGVETSAKLSLSIPAWLPHFPANLQP